MRRGLCLPILLTLTLLTAGCLAADDGCPDCGAAPTPPDTAAATNLTLYLTGDWGLTPAPPVAEAPQRATAGSFYARWATGAAQPTWTGAPTAGDLLLTGNVTLTWWVEAREAVATTGPGGHGFPEYVVYFGTAESPLASASVEGPNAMVAGEPVRLEAALPLPAGGFVLEAGARPVVIIAPVQGQGEDAAALDFLVNATTAPSRAAVAAAPVDVPAPAWRTAATHEGTLVGSAYAGASPLNQARHAVAVNGTVDRLALRLTSDGAGVRDIDLALEGPDGALVAQSVTPHPIEGLVLHAPALDAAGRGQWTAVVSNYGHAAVEYRLEVVAAGR